jgi:hypothetical protein
MSFHASCKGRGTVGVERERRVGVGAPDGRHDALDVRLGPLVPLCGGQLPPPRVKQLDAVRPRVDLHARQAVGMRHQINELG